MKLKVNPTRQELLRIKKRLKTARSGHALLKEKLDGLMREFLSDVRKLKLVRREIEGRISPALLNFFVSSNRIGRKKMSNLLKDYSLSSAEVFSENIMGVEIKRIALEKKEPKEVLPGHDSYFSQAKQTITMAVQEIIDYANLTVKIRLLANEIEKTRRRVNSLEYVYIPEMEKAKKYIFQKLEERERFDRTVILKLKEFIDN
jgi:V/A-type H+/Na+-transporting ATPase subunit D